MKSPLSKNLGILSMLLLLPGCGLFQKNEPASLQQTQEIAPGIQETQPKSQSEVLIGTLIDTSLEDSESAFLKKDDGTTVFIIAANADINFPQFVGKRVEVKGIMSYPPNPAARDDGSFRVSEISLK